MTATNIGGYQLPVLSDEDHDALEALGVASDIDARPNAQPARDAQASNLLRVLGIVQREHAEAIEAKRFEIERIEARYQTRLNRLERQGVFLESAIHALAHEADFGAKKSREVGYGTYGLRRVPATVAITDDAALLEACEAEEPDLVQVTVTHDLAWMRTHAPLALDERAKKTVSRAAMKQLVLEGGDLPGVKVVPAYEQPFAKPNAL